MKLNIYCVLILCLISSNVFSDENIYEGVKSISGSISYDRYNSSPGHSSRFQVSPKFIYFISDNIGLGAVSGFGRAKESNFNVNSYEVGPIFRFYIGRNGLLPYASFEYVYAKAKFTGENILNDTFTSKIMSVAFGADYFVAPNVAIEAEYKYTSNKQKVVFDSDFSSASSSNELTRRSSRFNIGINVFF